MATTHQRFGSAASETASQAGDAAKSVTETVGEFAKEKAGQVGEAAKGMATRATEAVKDTVGKAGDAAKQVADKASEAVGSVGHNVRSFANTMRENGPQGGFLGAADSAVASTLDSAGRELEQGFSVMAEDFTNTIRKNPLPSILIAMGVGYLMARAFSKS